jgi:hypothetical protein
MVLLKWLSVVVWQQWAQLFRFRSVEERSLRRGPALSRLQLALLLQALLLRWVARQLGVVAPAGDSSG